MTSDQTAQTIWYILVFVMVLSAVFSRRISLKHGVGLLVFWCVILGAVAALYSYRHAIGAIFDRQSTAPDGDGQDKGAKGTSGASRQSIPTTQIDLSDDGHFWVDGQINGHHARFLVDSGATITALSEQTAKDAGLTVDDDGPGVMMQTANGRMVARRTNISGLDIGPIRLNDLGAIVAPGFGDVNVLGMNFLSRLRSWRVENGQMILQQ